MLAPMKGPTHPLVAGCLPGPIVGTRRTPGSFLGLGVMGYPMAEHLAKAGRCHGIQPNSRES